jgi:hypothetical protein
MSLEIYQGTARGQFKPPEAFLLTARQYGEVVLPDASTGWTPGTLARNLSRCKEGMACVFAVRVRSFLNITSVGVQAFKVTEKLSRYCYFINSTGAVSRYRWERSQNWLRCRSLIVSTGAKSRCCGQQELSW